MSVREKQREMPGGRPHVFRMRLSDDERERLFALAAAEGVSVARYVLAVVLAGETPRAQARARGDMLEVRRLLVRTAANVNQATKVAHMAGSTRQLERMAGQLDAAVQRLDAALGGRW